MMNSALINEHAIARFGEDADFVRGLSVVTRVLGSDIDSTLISAAMLLLSPLALRTRRVPIAVAWLATNGFSVEYARQVHLDRQQVRRIWKFQAVKPDPARVRIVRRFMTSGPCLLLIAVESSSSPELSAAARLRTLKGPADPHRCSPHHLRAHMGAANMFNNLVHTPDGPAEVARESAVLLNDAELTTMWRRVSEARSGGTQQGRDEALAATPATSIPGGISLTHVAIALRLQLLHDIRSMLPEPLSSVESLLAAEKDWVEQKDETQSMKTLIEYRLQFAPLYPLLNRFFGLPERRLRSLLLLFRETEGALFGTGFDIDILERSATEAEFDLEIRDRIVLETEWLSLCAANTQQK